LHISNIALRQASPKSAYSWSVNSPLRTGWLWHFTLAPNPLVSLFPADC